MSEKTALELEQELAHELTTEHGHTIKTIFLIAEMICRESFVELGYGSIWDYLRRVHKQSDTMIHYRLRCAQAVNRFPQVIEPLCNGSLCMTTLAKLMEVLNESNCDALLAEALGKSKKTAERIVAREKPQPIPKDVTRPVTSTFLGKSNAEQAAQANTPNHFAMPVETEVLTEALSRVHMTVDREYEDLLRSIRSAYSHKLPGAADFELLKECMRVALQQDEKKKGIVDNPRADKIGKGGKISRSVKRIVRKRDQGKCQWRSDDGGICGSTHRVQFHHKQDRSKGGDGSPANIILLCQKHNLLAAEISCGEQEMERFRKRPRQQAPEPVQSRLEFVESQRCAAAAAQAQSARSDAARGDRCCASTRATVQLAQPPMVPGASASR